MPEEQPTPLPEHTLAQGGLPSAWEPPEQFGRYHIRKQLGKGGMGAVYLAHDTQLDRPVAIKIPRFNATEGASVLERFYREARSAATITHPNICPVFDVGEVQGVHYLTMAYLEGRLLSAFIKGGKVQPLNQVVGLVRKLALALQEAHKKGIIHRDLKPSNVMVTARGEPVIMDFGLARRTNTDDARITKDGVILGTPAYMSPEQVVGDLDALGPASDIYSLGVILYELLTLRLPFHGPIMGMLARILTEEPEPPSKHRPDTDSQLEAICRKAMAKKPAERYASMAEFAAALSDYLKGAKTGTIAPPLGGAPKPPPLPPAIESPDTKKPPAVCPPPLPGAGEGFPALRPAPILTAPDKRARGPKRGLGLAVTSSVLLTLIAVASFVHFGTNPARSTGRVKTAQSAPEEAITQPAEEPAEKKAETGTSKLAALVKSLKEDDDHNVAAASAKLAAMGSAAVGELRGLLKDDKARTRRRAAATLGELGPAAAAVVGDLTPLLRDADGTVRLAAVQALGKIGPAAKPAMSQLVQALADPDEALRQAAGQALNRFAPLTSADVPFLSTALADEKVLVRRYAVQTLAQMALENAEAMRLFSGALKDPDKDVRRHAARALGKVGPGAKDAALAKLLEALRDPETEVRRDVLEALTRLGPITVSQMPTLQAALKDREPEVRRYAARTLGALGREAGPVLPALLDLLHDANKDVSQAAAEALVRITPDPKEILPVLTQALKDPNPLVRRLAGGVLTSFLPQARDAILPVLFEALLDQNADVTRVIAQGLERCGPMTRAELPFLTKALQNGSKPARLFAAQTLPKLDARVTVYPLLLEALKDDDADVRRAVTDGLERLGTPTKADLPLLLETLKRSRPAARAYAAATLGNIGPDAGQAVPALTEALKDNDPSVARAAASALGAVGPAALPAVPKLAACVRDGEKELRKQAAMTLGRLGPDAKAAVPDLIEALKQPDKELIVAAIGALGRIGPASKPAVPLLIRALNSDQELHQNAIIALAMIGKDAVPALTEALKDRRYPAMRLGAAMALGQIGADAKGPAVIQLSLLYKKDPDPAVRQAAFLALQSIQRKP